MLFAILDGLIDVKYGIMKARGTPRSAHLDRLVALDIVFDMVMTSRVVLGCWCQILFEDDGLMSRKYG